LSDSNDEVRAHPPLVQRPALASLVRGLLALALLTLASLVRGSLALALLALEPRPERAQKLPKRYR
jgi:hypothetical protein